MKDDMKITAAEFKAKCLKLMDRVARSREPIVITKRGKPIAKLVPADPEKTKPLFGYMAGTVEILGDIVNTPAADWAALSGEEDHLYERDAPAPTDRADGVAEQGKRRKARKSR
jgi:prevent-host-death family protein